MRTSANTASRRASAYRILGIDPKSISDVAPISPQLKLIAKTFRKRGLPDSAFFYLSCSTDTGASEVFRLYRSLPPDHRNLVPIEAYCIAAGLPTLRALEIIQRHGRRLCLDRSTLIAAAAHPKVTEKTIQMALTDDGIEDRRDLHKAVGFLPTPHGAKTTVNVAANANAQAAAPIAILAPVPEQTTRRLADKLNELRGLPPVRTLELPTSPEATTIDPIQHRQMVAVEAESDDDMP